MFNEISISVRAYLCIKCFNELGEFTIDDECADIGDATSRELLIRHHQSIRGKRV